MNILICVESNIPVLWKIKTELSAIYIPSFVPMITLFNADTGYSVEKIIYW